MSDSPEFDVVQAVRLLRGGENGIREWNEKRADLFGLELPFVDLSHAMLRGADLSGCNLEGANFVGSDLRGANLSKADCDKADLSNTQLDDALLFGTSFREAKFHNTKLSPQQIADSLLLLGADFSDHDFSGWDLHGLNLSKVNLSRANLNAANLENADLSDATLVGADLRGALIRGANFSKVKLSGMDLSGRDLRGCSFVRALLINCNFGHSNLQKADCDNANLKGAILVNTDLTDATLRGAVLVEANLEGANCQHADFNGADLTRAKLRGATFKGAFLGSANLSESEFEHVEISDAYTTPPEFSFSDGSASDAGPAGPEAEVRVIIYLPNADFSEDLVAIEALRNSVDDFMEAFGFELEPEADPITRFGSWYGEVYYRTKKVLTAVGVRKIFERMKDALLGVAVDKANAEILERRASATAKLLAQIEKFDEAVLRLGGVLIVKATVNGKTRLVIETISQSLSRQLENDPLLMQRPRDLFTLLAEGTSSELSSPQVLALSDVPTTPAITDGRDGIVGPNIVD